MADIFDMADTWNSGATTFTAIKMNVTDTASASASLLLQLQTASTDRFTVRKSGLVYSASSFTTNVSYNISANVDGTNQSATFDLSGLRLASGAYMGFTSASSGFGSMDTYFNRDAAGVMNLRNTTNAQTLRISGTRTDASNYRWVSVGMTTAGVGHIRPEGAGTGASGNVLHISGLPTSNPGPGILWNNAGTPAIGT